MIASGKRIALLVAGGVSLALVTAYFGMLCAAGFERLGGQRAYYSGEFPRAWNLYQNALRLGGDREELETDLVETLLFGLDQQVLGVKVELPMPSEAAASKTGSLLAGLLRMAPYKAYYWSLVSDLNLFKAREGRKRAPLDLSTLSENPLENLRPEEGVAVAALNEATRREPGNYVYQDLLAEQYLEWGAVEPATEHVRKAVALYPITGGHTYLAASPIDQGVVDAALAGFDDALSAESMIPRESIECEAGSLLLDQRRYAEAVTYFQRALTQVPGMPDALYRYGVANYLLGRYREADEMLTRAARFFPDLPSVHLYLGRARLEEGKRAEGLEALRAAREIDPHNVELFHALAEVLESGGEIKEAERQYTAAAHLNPTRTEAWTALLDFYSRHAELAASARRTCTHLAGLKIDPQVYKARCDSILRSGM